MQEFLVHAKWPVIHDLDFIRQNLRIVGKSIFPTNLGIRCFSK